MKAHKAPNSAAPSIAAGISSQAGSAASKASMASVRPRPPKYIWPSLPMLNRPAFIAIDTASPVKMKVEA